MGRKLTRMAFAPFPSRARRFLDASRTGARMQRCALDTGSQSATVSAAETAVDAGEKRFEALDEASPDNIVAVNVEHAKAAADDPRHDLAEDRDVILRF